MAVRRKKQALKMPALPAASDDAPGLPAAFGEETALQSAEPSAAERPAVPLRRLPGDAERNFAALAQALDDFDAAVQRRENGGQADS